MKSWTIKIILIILAIAVLVFLYFFIRGFFVSLKEEPSSFSTPTSTAKIDYNINYPSSTTDQAGFDQKKEGSGFVAYYHNGDGANANKSLAVLQQTGLDLYQTYLGIEPQEILLYLAISAEEYVKIADFPGGLANVQIGDGSAPNGKIYLYKPFDDPNSAKTEGMIIHEGVHAVIYQFLGQEKVADLPGFLNEGLAHYIEYVFKAGADFQPLEQIYHADLLEEGAKTGKPKLMSLDELAKNCEGYIADEETNFLCRGQGTFTVWYLIKTYGQDFWAKFLVDLKSTADWQKSLQNLTTKNASQLGQDIDNSLKSLVNTR